MPNTSLVDDANPLPVMRLARARHTLEAVLHQLRNGEASELIDAQRATEIDDFQAAKRDLIWCYDRLTDIAESLRLVDWLGDGLIDE
jgi:hypothetical protein